MSNPFYAPAPWRKTDVNAGTIAIRDETGWNIAIIERDQNEWTEIATADLISAAPDRVRNVGKFHVDG